MVDRQERVRRGCDKLLLAAEALNETNGITADAMVSAAVSVLCHCLNNDIALTAERLRDIANDLTAGRAIDGAANMEVWH